MDYRQQLVDAGKRMLAEKLTMETWGNLSLRDPESGCVYITPSGMDYRSIQAADIVRLDPDGRPPAGARRPSIETGLHLAVYAARPEVQAIVHSHPRASMVFACTGETIPVFCDEMAQSLGGPVPVCDYALPGTAALAAACVQGLGKGMACLLRSHGAVCVGRNMEEALKTAHVLEYAAELYWRILAMGRLPQPLGGEEIAYMWDFACNRYGKPGQ